SVASTASITMNGLERPVKKQRVSPLIPRYYQPLAKRVPGIAVNNPPYSQILKVFFGRFVAASTTILVTSFLSLFAPLRLRAFA
ncbi:MAG: hypothetical protein ACLQNE_07220, partial [Thermoguttaceae bacterium]